MSMPVLATLVEGPQQRQGLAPLTLMVPHPVVSANLVFGLILRRSRKMMLELLLSIRCVVLDLVLVLVI
jgi:hypothetical protein